MIIEPEVLRRWAASRGYRIAWGPATVVAEARTEILGRRASGEIEASFWDDNLAGVAVERPWTGGGSVIVVAKPRPGHVVAFDVHGAEFEAVLPPTYVRYRAVFEDVRQDLARALPGTTVEHLAWPAKAVAARLGLVRYGRNNVTYADGIGSYMQLCAFLIDVDLPSPERELREGPKLLDQCADCAACMTACPTGAIDADRVLLHGERCLTHLNENKGAWPSWVPPAAHNALIGCLLCQRACPANAELPLERTAVRFSARETDTLLSDERTNASGVENGIGVKLAWLGQPYAEPVIGRNLRALIDARREPAP